MHKIALSATGGLLSTWNVEFRPYKGQYRVHGLISTPLHNLPSWKFLGTLSGPFDLRDACDLLQSLDEDGLSGNWLGKIAIKGVDVWQAELLQMAAITEDNPCYDELQFLLELSDPDIQWIRVRVGTLHAEPARDIVRILSQVLQDGDDSSRESALDAILRRLKLDRNASESKFRTSIDQYEVARQETRKKRLRPFDDAISQTVSRYKTLKASNALPAVAHRLTRALEDFVLQHGCLPDEISVPNVGVVDVLALRYQTVEAFIAERAPKDPIPPATLALCTQFAPPTDKKALDRILYAWVHASPKPDAMKLFEIGWRTKLGFLPWALGARGYDELERFGETYPNEAEVIRQWLRRQADKIDAAVTNARAHNHAQAAILAGKRAFLQWVRKVC